MIPTLETPRLLIRAWRDHDLGPWADMCADERVMRYLGPTLDRARAVADAAMLARRLEDRGYGWWVLEVKHTSAFAGLVAAAINLASQRVMQRLGMSSDPRDDFECPLAASEELRPYVLYRIQASGLS